MGSVYDGNSAEFMARSCHVSTLTYQGGSIPRLMSVPPPRFRSKTKGNINLMEALFIKGLFKDEEGLLCLHDFDLTFKILGSDLN